jgi:hypothetical protein
VTTKRSDVGAGLTGWLYRDTFNSEVTNVCALAGMLERDRTNVTLGIRIKDRVFIEVLRLRNIAIAKFYV